MIFKRYPHRCINLTRDAGDKEKALAAGCTGYITKPIDTRKFLETVSQYLKDDDQ